jgi:hypothetical protein
MSTCSVPKNQSIYQALCDKAASYPADKPYQAKAYKKAAEYIASMKDSIYDERGEFYGWWCPPSGSSIGWKIEEFINEFLKANPKPTEAISFAADNLTGAAKAMDDARKAAAAAAPKDVTTWPKNDAAERAAFQQKLAASKVNDPSKTVVEDGWTKFRASLDMPAPPKPVWTYNSYLESLKPVVYTAENPRRSKRNIGKPQKKYFTEEDEQDEISEVIEAVCAKKGYEFSDDLITEFNIWVPTADKYSTEKYDYKTGKYIPRTKLEMAKEWAMYYSTSLQQQQKQKKLSKTIMKYCLKHGFDYYPLMDQKFAEWKADPANKKLITTTISSYGGCNCSSCDPTGTKKATTTEYSYERSPTYCINKWFSTLKKTVVL